jgi:hypothetical protein
VLLILRATTLLQRQDLPLGPAAVAGRRRRRDGAARTLTGLSISPRLRAVGRDAFASDERATASPVAV